MTDKTAALVALADSWQRAADQMEAEGDYRAAVFPRHYAKQLREALAAPAEGDGAVAWVYRDDPMFRDDWQSTTPMLYREQGLRKDLVPLYTRPAATAVVPDAWEAIVESCMVTEAVTPVESDPRGTINRLIDYHVQMNAAPAAPKGGEVDRLRSALQAIADYADDPNTPVRNSVKKSALARAAIATGEQS